MREKRKRRGGGKAKNRHTVNSTDADLALGGREMGMKREYKEDEEEDKENGEEWLLKE